MVVTADGLLVLFGGTADAEVRRLNGQRRQLSGFGWPEGHPKVPSGQLRAPL
eukprot:SAG31_NODE_6143_length_2150_cov_17.266212_2_plen_51_part_01